MSFVGKSSCRRWERVVDAEQGSDDVGTLMATLTFLFQSHSNHVMYFMIHASDDDETPA
jgi:hypothetical protein